MCNALVGPDTGDVQRVGETHHPPSSVPIERAAHPANARRCVGVECIGVRAERVRQTGLEVRERSEHEGSFPRPRMRDGQALRVDGSAFVPEEIEVERPLGPTSVPRPSPVRLNRQQGCQERLWVEIGVEPDNGIEIQALSVWTPDRLGFIDR